MSARRLIAPVIAPLTALVAIALIAPLAHAEAPLAPLRPSAPSAPSAAIGGGGRAASAPATISELRRLGDAFAEVAEKVSPSVVQIDVTADGSAASPLRRLDPESTQKSTGSGVIFSADGAIITNNHVIDGARAISVRLRDGRIFQARLAGRDPATDLAVIRIDANNLPAATFADSDAAKVGEWVIAIGSPFGLDHSVTTGVLSAKGRGGVGVNAVEDYLQTDASINPGNSGGPLVNLDGQVLGINTMIVSRGQGIGLAVPSSMARRVASQLLQTGRVRRAWLGIGLQDLTPAIAAELPSAPANGALVNAVSSGGPAEAAHIEPGDIVVTIGGKPAREAQDVIREVLAHDVGDVLPLEIARAGKRYNAKATLKERVEQRPSELPIERQPNPSPGLGFAVRDINDPGAISGSARTTLAQITDVVASSVADREGLRPGDIVLEADGTKQPIATEIQTAAKDGRLLLRIRRRGATFFTALRR